MSTLVGWIVGAVLGWVVKEITALISAYEAYQQSKATAAQEAQNLKNAKTGAEVDKAASDTLNDL